MLDLYSISHLHEISDEVLHKPPSNMVGNNLFIVYYLCKPK